MVSPENCPEPFWHNTHMYCPHCTFTAEEAKKASPILKFFSYEHLPPHLQDVSYQFSMLANWVEGALPDGPEKTVALRKLLEGKDAAVRAMVEATQ